MIYIFWQEQFYQNTKLIFAPKFKNNPSLSRRAKSQIFNFKNKYVHCAVNVMYKIAENATQLANCILLNFSTYSSRAATPNYTNTKTSYSLFNELA